MNLHWLIHITTNIDITIDIDSLIRINTDPPEAPSSYGPAPHFALGHKNYMTAHAIVVVADAAVAGSGPPPKPSQSSS